MSFKNHSTIRSCADDRPVMQGCTILGIALLLASLSFADTNAQTHVASSKTSLRLKDPLDGQIHPLLPAFKMLDKDNDGRLTNTEYLATGGRDKVLKRDFSVFDANQDGALSFAEFITIPLGQPEDQRGVIDDPVILLAESRLKVLFQEWEQTLNTRDSITPAQFEASRMASNVPGLESTKFQQWDLNADGTLSQTEAARTVEIAYGIRTPDGQFLRNNAGRVVDWPHFRRMKIDAKGMVSKADYVAVMTGVPNVEEWFNTIDKNHDDQFNYAEFATGGHRTDPVGTFLNLDQDLNGRVSLKELQQLPPSWLRMAVRAYDGFDEDRDGALSLPEYQLLPHCNLLAGWPDASDANHDGKLTREEFKFMPGIPLAALTDEYFTRLDIDGNDVLTLDEFPFQTRFHLPNEIVAQMPDGSSVTIAIPTFPMVYSPEVSPDGKFVAADGWNNGQPSTAAHLLVANLVTHEVRDLGVGCIPHWSADGKRIGYSSYGDGVYIRKFDDGNGQPELIDAQGWSIHFARDGKKAAYVKNGNFVIYDLATGQKQLVFPENKSPYTQIEHNFSWSPDSTRLCFKGHRPNGQVDIAIVSTNGRDPELKVRLDGKTIQSDIAWHPDGKRIMFPAGVPELGRSQIHEVEADGNQPPKLFTPQPGELNVIGISFSLDGKTISFMTTNDGSR